MTTPAQPPPQQWSAICPGDLGYKVGIRRPDGSIGFVPVIGWVTVTMKEPDGSVSNGFHAVIHGANHLPQVAALAAGYAGTFQAGVTPKEAEDLIKQWTKAAAPQPKITQGPAKA
jgi:hypothetical protein